MAEGRMAEGRVVVLEVTKSPDPRLSVMSLVGACALLAATIAPAAMAISAIGNRGFSMQALAHAAIAGGICWLAGAGALSATYFGNQFHAPVQGVLAAMAFRMGLPLLALIVLQNSGGLTGGNGITTTILETTILATTILGVYLVTLVIETILALRLVPTQAGSHQAAAKAT